MGLFGPSASAKPDPHGKVLTDAERKAMIRRIESDLAILQGDRLKLGRKKDDRDLALRKLRVELRRIQMEIEQFERETKKDEADIHSLEEEIRLTKKRLVSL